MVLLMNGTRGGAGSSKKRVGSRGMDKIVQVPVGTVIHIARGSIPSLELVSHSKEDRTWEDSEGVDLHTSNTPPLDITQQVKTARCTGRQVEHFEDLAERAKRSKDALERSENLLSSSSLEIQKDKQQSNLDELKRLAQCLKTDKQDSLEASSCHSAAAPPCSGSDDQTNVSGASLGIHESEGDRTDHEEDEFFVQLHTQCAVERTKDALEYTKYALEHSESLLSSSSLYIKKYGQQSSTGSLDDSKRLAQGLDTDKQDSQEDSSCHSAAAPPCSGSDDQTSMSGESVDIHESEGDGTDHEEDGSLYQKVQSSVAEFTKVGQSFILACGGDGGKGNAAMARGRGSEKGLPSFEHEQGQLGSEADLILELKTIADVGLVGAPNAGKSTLLGSLSKAKPAIGHYKFTTLRPNIGMLDYEDFFNLTVADIPGLIEGAHENRGLGHAFLRHIERTKVLAYVIDLAGGIGDDTGPLPWDQFEELVSELEKYQKGLSQRPSIIVANKIDEEGALAALQVLREKVPFLEIYPVCAVLEEGVDTLKLGLRKLVEASQADSLPLSQPRDL